jgi:predicted dehydrogenase
MIRVGIAGLGFMGMVHWLSYARLRGVRVVAVCDRKRHRRTGDWRDIKGNFGPPGERVDLSQIATYDDVDAMIQDPRLDLLDITLPPSLHADVAVRALNAGKHVFCEKPLALKTRDASRMLASARQADRLLLVGHVLPFFREYAWALRVIRSGKYGRLRCGAFKRIICEPTWLRNYWTVDRVGGPMLDLHVHDAHFIRLLFGLPVAVKSRGHLRGSLPEYWHTQYDFLDEAIVVHSTAGVINQAGRSFDQGFEIQLERATLAFEFAVIDGKGEYLCVPTLFDDRGNVQRPKLTGDPMDAFAGELGAVVRSIRTEQISEFLGAGLAQDAMRICEAETASLHRGRSVRL